MAERFKGRRLVLHVGLPKTGTKTLQRFCAANLNRIGGISLQYGDLGAGTDIRHQYLVSYLMGDSKYESYIYQQIRRDDVETILFSSEGLTNHLYDFSTKNMKNFREMIAERHVEVDLVVRDPNTWLNSYYKQCVINPPNSKYLYGTDLALSEFQKTERVKRLLNIETLSQDIVTGFGAREFRLWNADTNWIPRILNQIGLADQYIPSRRDNIGAPIWLVEIARQINAMGLNAELRAGLLAIMQRIEKTGSVTMAGYRGVEDDHSIIHYFEKVVPNELCNESTLVKFLREIEIMLEAQNGKCN